MGCAFRGYDVVPRMPLMSQAAAAAIQAHHREKNPMDQPMSGCSLVARPVGRKERNETPAALEAVAKEWLRLRNITSMRGASASGTSLG